VKVHEIDAMGRTNLTALGMEQELPSLSDNASADPSAVKMPERRGGGDRDRRGGDRDRRGGGDRDRRGGDRDRGGYNRDRRDDRGGDRDRGDRPERSERSEPSERPVRVEQNDHEMKPREDAGFPKKEDVDPSTVARFRPKR
jgi:hypothetical protein